jgi:hypothetical protein
MLKQLASGEEEVGRPSKKVVLYFYVAGGDAPRPPFLQILIRVDRAEKFAPHRRAIVSQYPSDRN